MKINVYYIRVYFSELQVCVRNPHFAVYSLFYTKLRNHKVYDLLMEIL